jgi:hypothetical protein
MGVSLHAFLTQTPIVCENEFVNAVFWVVAPCSILTAYQRFKGKYCLRHQPWRRRQYVLPKLWRSAKLLHGAKTQNTTYTITSPWKPQILQWWVAVSSGHSYYPCDNDALSLPSLPAVTQVSQVGKLSLLLYGVPFTLDPHSPPRLPLPVRSFLLIFTNLFPLSVPVVFIQSFLARSQSYWKTALKWCTLVEYTYFPNAFLAFSYNALQTLHCTIRNSVACISLKYVEKCFT